MSTHQQKSFFIGAALAFIPGVLWGLSGVFGQHLFQHYDINAEWPKGPVMAETFHVSRKRDTASMMTVEKKAPAATRTQQIGVAPKNVGSALLPSPRDAAMGASMNAEMQ